MGENYLFYGLPDMAKWKCSVADLEGAAEEQNLDCSSSFPTAPALHSAAALVSNLDLNP